MGKFLAVPLLVAAALALAACQSSGVRSDQSGPESSTASPVKASSPVEQDQRSINVGGSTVIFTPGSIPAPTADGRGGAVEINVFNGPHASSDGDVKGQGRTETGQTDGKTSTQSNTPTQHVSLDPKAIAEAATSLLATVTPGGEAAKLAKSALDAANAGDEKTASDLLTKAKTAAATEKAPGSPPGG